MAGFRLAIDLGTSHTVAVVRRGEESPRALLFDGSPLLPSAIYSEPPRLHVGRDAERMALVDPGRFEPHPKRRVDEGGVLLGNTEVSVIDMLAEVLRRVAAEAVQAGVPAGGDTVLTCPADWAAQRRGVLLQAARVAGLGPVHLVDEPIAAASYCVEVLGQQVPVGHSLAVFDFGGGTLDVSVVRRDPDGLRVLAIGGLDDLGGVDVDAALVGHIGQLVAMRSPRIWQRLSNPGGSGEQRERRTFWNEVRGAKEMLSRAAAAPVHVPGMDSLHITREELERVAGPLIDRAVDETRRVLERAGVDSHTLVGLFLVGGSSRIPLVASRLHTRFGVPPMVPEQPELPVAYGALLAAQVVSLHRPVQRTAGPAPAHPVSTPPRQVSTPPVSAPPQYPSHLPPQPVSTPPVAPVSFGGPDSAPPHSYPPFPVPPSTTMPPVPGPPPPFGRPGPPPARRRFRGLRYIALAMVAVVLLCGGGVYGLYKAITSVGDKLDGANGDPGGGGGGDVILAGGEPVALPAAQAAAVTVGGDTAYYATVGPSDLRVAALPVAGGPAKWEINLAMRPADLELTVVADLLVVDGSDAATHGGKDVRAVVRLDTGATTMTPREWDDRYDVAYFGTDAIVEVRAFRSVGVARIDLRTGQQKWIRQFTPRAGTIISDRHRIEPLRTLEAKAGAGLARPFRGLFGLGPFVESVAADPAGLVELIDEAGRTSVIDPANGAAKLSAAALPIELENWTVHSGVVVGMLTDQAAPGASVLVGYGVGDLKEKWRMQLPPGSEIERIKPCGPTQVCVDSESSQGSIYQVFAVDVGSGKQLWTKQREFADEANWYIIGGRLLWGTGTFSDVKDASLRDPASGADGLTFGTHNISSASASRIAYTDLDVDTEQWLVTVADLGTGKVIGSVRVGDEPATDFVVSDAGLVVLTKDKRVVRAAVPKA